VGGAALKLMKEDKGISICAVVIHTESLNFIRGPHHEAYMYVLYMYMYVRMYSITPGPVLIREHIISSHWILV
jgi:hypothetical protein